MKYLLIGLNELVKFWWKLDADLDTRTQNNFKRMVSKTKRIYKRIRKHPSNYTKTVIRIYTKTIIRLRLDFVSGVI